MHRILLDPYDLDYPALMEAATAVRKGAVMVYPTDTVYGLGCDIHQKAAIARIEALKERERGKPFSFICRDMAQISEFAFIPTWAFRLMSRLLPGPYTFILEARRSNLPKKMIGKRNTVGVRIPDHPVTSLLVELVGSPLVTTSVNLAGELPVADLSTLPDQWLSRIDILIDAGPLLADPSTVVDCTGSSPETIRGGAGPVDW